MKLRDINIRGEELDKNDTIHVNTEPIEFLYLKKLKKSIHTNDVSRINIYLTKNHQFKIGDLAAGWLDCYIYFDTTEFNKLNDFYSKKLRLLDIILSTLLQCAEIKGWEKDPILDAYNECLKVRLKNEWWFKNKLFKSPNGEFFAGLYNIYDLDAYTVYIVVHDSKKKELERRIVFKDRGLGFPLEWASWEKTNDTFYFKFKPPAKVFSVKISDVLNKTPYNLPSRTSDWFKK